MSTSRRLVNDAYSTNKLATPAARDAFLSSGTAERVPVHPWLRLSWERSHHARVDADQPRAAFIDDWQAETTLTRAAQQVFDELAKEIESEPVCLILTDAKGTVRDRRGGDPALLQHLDRVYLAPGFAYSEAHVGTNGIGTALEVGAPVLVNGHEHYSGALTRFSCAGALITHPTSGTLLGVVDLTTFAGNTNALMLSFAKMAARRIRDRILENACALEHALLDDYYATCRHSGKPVLAVGGDVLMLNAQIYQRFDAHDQAAIIAQAHEVHGSTNARSILSELPSGLAARLAYRPSFAGEQLAGGIVVVREQAMRTQRGAGPQVILRGVVGDSPIWRRVAASALSACVAGRWTVLQGEPGSGRSRLLQAAHDHARGDRRLYVHDASATTGGPGELLETLDTELRAGSDLAILNASSLQPDLIDGIADLLQDIAGAAEVDGPWVAMTVDDGDDGHSLPLLRLFGSSIAVPPLRQHAEDLPALARHLLERMRATDLTLSAAAVTQLTRLAWPGNVRQLHAVLQRIAHQHRAGTIEVDDLPAACHATSRRKLTHMESLERDAIVEALSLHGGDKSAAAESLGISRATIYRRIRDFGIVV